METSQKTLPDIPGDLLEKIFLWLPTPEDLAHTSAVCVTFRGVVTDGSFLRSFRRLHAPLVLGFFAHSQFHPAPPPHPSAPAARALALAADFSFSFLPSYCRWGVRDSRDGRVLLARKPEKDEEPPIFTELVVCDPLHRRYILLPPVPEDLVASVENSVNNFFGRFCVPFLISPNKAEETDFRVIWMARCGINLAVLVFSSSTGEWRAASSSQDWRDIVVVSDPFCFLRPHFAGGCIYWDSPLNQNKLLVLDTKTMEFSIADFPPGEWDEKLAIVDAGEGRFGMFGIHDGDEGGESVLSYMVGQNEGESSGQLKKVSLGYGHQYYFTDYATQNYLILLRAEASPYEVLSRTPSKIEFFSLDVKTAQLERMFIEPSKFGCSRAHIYTNFPPSLLSSPTI
ncbi:hypothetical protein VPH35_126096 [Triticum aestivum]|uniref:uncharacterized protein n=1 Tax=Triticum aestivum TaxID=4565 RepID=UPI000844F8DB|nr:uncharacterized protein LOC123146839 [Triticum aestivum]